MTLLPHVERLSREGFDLRGLRPAHAQAIDAVGRRRDTLAVMPAASGPSAVSEIAALLLGGTTLVISPRIAVDDDHVEGLDGIEGPRAVVTNSLIPEAEKQTALAALAGGDPKVLFLAPDQLDNAEVRARAQEARPSLIVVDEAQCISAWDADFR